MYDRVFQVLIGGIHTSKFFLSIKIGSPFPGKQVYSVHSHRYVSSCICDGCITSSSFCPSNYHKLFYCSHCSKSKVDYYDIQRSKKLCSWQLTHQRKRSRGRSELALRSSLTSVALEAAILTLCGGHRDFVPCHRPRNELWERDENVVCSHN